MGGRLYNYNPQKTHMEPENTFLENEKHLQTSNFGVPCLFSGVSGVCMYDLESQGVVNQSSQSIVQESVDKSYTKDVAKTKHGLIILNHLTQESGQIIYNISPT